MNFILGEPGPLSAEELERRAKAQQHLADSADPALLRRIDRWIQHRMVPLNPSLPMAVRPQRTHFDRLADWYAGYLGVRAEYEPPYELTRDLKERVPQALLRDIYRPVRSQSMVEPHYHELDLDPAGQRALAEARQALVREPIPTIEPVLLDVIAEQRRRRRFLEQPWASFHPDNAPRRYRDRSPAFFGYADEDGE